MACAAARNGYRSRKEVAMNERNPNAAGHMMPAAAYPAAQFAVVPGERWRRFLERVGTRSNDFPVRLSRARFVYLHRRETATQWLPL
jgi:hypothetical protein